MSDITETTTAAPTAWFVHIDRNGNYTSVARWFWPSSATAEVYNIDTDTWEPSSRDLFETLGNEPDWQMVSQDDAEGLIARSGSAAPGSPEQSVEG